jgi:cytochrome P450
MQSFIRHGLTQEDAVAESLLQILAGSDTSATAFRTIMLYLMTNHKVYAKLQTEISEAVESGTVSSPVITDSEARKLPYLQAVIREGLRILPPAAGTVPRTVPPEGDTINGVFVPGGTNIGTNLWAIMRNTKIWGEDAEVFRPERWLETLPEKLKDMENASELVFGYGKWKCLGMGIAKMELNKLLFEVCDFLVSWMTE